MMTLFRKAGKISEPRLYKLELYHSEVICQRFIVRDFVYSEEEISKQQRELELAATTEKELWVRIFNLAIYEWMLKLLGH